LKTVPDLLIRVVAAALAMTVVACGGDDGNRVQRAALETRIDAIEAQVRTLAGPAVCSVDDECRALPLGALACGGPSKFVPYSIRATDEGSLGSLSADHRRLSAELLAQQQAVGPCVALAVPTAYCDRSAPLACKLR
jgi:hypothetical protein